MIPVRNAGRFAGTYNSTPREPRRNQPFREFTIIYHDEVAAFRRFQLFNDPAMFQALKSVKTIAINYGTGGIGAEICRTACRSVLLPAAPNASSRSSSSPLGLGDRRWSWMFRRTRARPR